MFSDTLIWANSADPDQTAPMISDQGLQGKPEDRFPCDAAHIIIKPAEEIRCVFDDNSKIIIKTYVVGAH